MIFDLDGVVTDTASVHREAWKQMLDECLIRRAQTSGRPQPPFTDDDYRRYVDGKPRDDGLRSFLASRGIELPEGSPDDPPDNETIAGLCSRKNDVFRARLEGEGVKAFPDAVRLLRTLRRIGLRTAIISASRNCESVLAAAGLRELFDVKVDGVDAAELGFAGKPDPAIFLEAARRLGVRPERAVVVEDALAGVAAGRAGSFALVVGVARTGHTDELERAGADVVVPELGRLGIGRPAWKLPSADGAIEELAGRRPAVFLDYDGTLTPIVEDPDAALLPEATRSVIVRLARSRPVAIVSGRDVDDVREKVDVSGIAYAGSHGFDLVRPDGTRTAYEPALDYLPDIDAATGELEHRLQGVRGAQVERKRFAVAAHFRRVSPGLHPRVAEAMDIVASAHPRLRRTAGKMVFELRPDLDWDKGTALRWLLGELAPGRPRPLPVYIGDDLTDEDAFREVHDGVGIIVRGADHPTLARYALDDPDHVHRFLERLAGVPGE